MYQCIHCGGERLNHTPPPPGRRKKSVLRFLPSSFRVPSPLVPSFRLKIRSIITTIILVATPEFAFGQEANLSSSRNMGSGGSLSSEFLELLHAMGAQHHSATIQTPAQLPDVSRPAILSSSSEMRDLVDAMEKSFKDGISEAEMLSFQSNIKDLRETVEALEDVYLGPITWTPKMEQELRKRYEMVLEDDRSQSVRRSLPAKYSGMTVDDLINCHKMYFEAERLQFNHRGAIRKSLEARKEAATQEAIDEKFVSSVKQTLLTIENLDYGAKADVNLLEDGGKNHYFIRVVHYPSGHTIMYPSAASFVQEMKHFWQYIAIQFFKANRSVLLVPLDNKKLPTSGKFFEMPRMLFGGYPLPKLSEAFTVGYWDNYLGNYYLTWKRRIAPEDVGMAALLTSIEIAAMFPIDFLTSNMHKAQYAVKAAFGIILGSTVASLKNWQQLKGRKTPEAVDKFNSVMKQVAISLPFGMAISLSRHGFEGLVDQQRIWAMLAEGGGITMVYLLANAMISGYVKDEFQQLTRALQEVRFFSSLRLFKDYPDNGISGLLKKHVTGRTMENLSHQGMRVVTGLIRYIDLVFMAAALGSDYFTHVTQYLASATGGVVDIPAPVAALIASRGLYFSLSVLPLYLNVSIFDKLIFRIDQRINAISSDIDNAADQHDLVPLVERRSRYEKERDKLLVRKHNFFSGFRRMWNFFRHPVQSYKYLTTPSKEVLDERAKVAEYYLRQMKTPHESLAEIEGRSNFEDSSTRWIATDVTHAARDLDENNRISEGSEPLMTEIRSMNEALDHVAIVESMIADQNDHPGAPATRDASLVTDKETPSVDGQGQPPSSPPCSGAFKIEGNGI